MKGAEETWAKNFAAIRDARDKVLEKLSAHTNATNQIKKLREEITELNNQLGDLEAELKAVGEPDRVETTYRGPHKTRPNEGIRFFGGDRSMKKEVERAKPIGAAVKETVAITDARRDEYRPSTVCRQGFEASPPIAGRPTESVMDWRAHRCGFERYDRSAEIRRERSLTNSRAESTPAVMSAGAFTNGTSRHDRTRMSASSEPSLG